MKKLLFILMIIPISGISQVKSFSDLKQISSAQQFKRVVLENGYSKNPKNNYPEVFLSYGIGLQKMDDGYYGATYWGEYFTENDPMGNKKNEWNFQFPRCINQNRVCYYKLIVAEIRKQCKFYKVAEDNYGREFVLYSCPGSSYQGKIGFHQDEDGYGKIKHLIGL